MKNNNITFKPAYENTYLKINELSKLLLAKEFKKIWQKVLWFCQEVLKKCDEKF